MRENVAKINPQIIPRSSSISSKFKDDELAGFVENNPVISQMHKKKEEELCFQIVQRSTAASTEQQDACPKHCSQEIKEFKMRIQLKKSYQGQETQQKC